MKASVISQAGDRSRVRMWNDPGSAAQHQRVLRCAREKFSGRAQPPMLPSPPARPHIRAMAKSPDPPDAPRPLAGPPPQAGEAVAPRGKRDPAKHSKKDPAKPTRAKASRPDSAPTDPALERLLNPGIRQGTAGIGSQTGHETVPRRAGGESGLQPPPDNSRDRRADFLAQHEIFRERVAHSLEARRAGAVNLDVGRGTRMLNGSASSASLRRVGRPATYAGLGNLPGPAGRGARAGSERATGIEPA